MTPKSRKGILMLHITNTTNRTSKCVIASLSAIACASGGFAFACMPAVAATDPARVITVNAGKDGAQTLKGRKLTAYKLADYVDGTYVSVGDKALDGVAVDTPDAHEGDQSLEQALNRVLAKTAGVADVSELPGWKTADYDPIAWMGGFRQTSGQNNQSAGSFGFGWNESGAQGKGNNSPVHAYTGSVREFADNLVKDKAALELVKAQPHSQTVSVDKAVESVTIDVPSTGVYLILDSGSATTWNGALKGKKWAAYSVDPSQPMIVPTKADDKDLATLDGHTPSDPDKLGTVGKLGEIQLKNNTVPVDLKHRNEDLTVDGRHPGLDAADNAVDVGDLIPYYVDSRVGDLSAYKEALDNNDPWIYNYRMVDQTDPGLKILDGTVLLTVTGIDGKQASVPLTKVDQLPAYAESLKGATADGQNTETADAWYYLAVDPATDASHLVVGFGKWLVKHYGDVRLNDNTKTLYEKAIRLDYQATVTDRILEHGNMTENGYHTEYSNNPGDVTSGDHATSPDVIIREWTYDIDLHKRGSTQNAGLAGAEFQVAPASVPNKDDRKDVDKTIGFVKIGDGEYRQPTKAETDANTKLTTTVVTGTDGGLSLRGLDLGAYTLTETKPAHNYQLLKNPETVEITAKFEDDETDFTTPNHQTEAKLTISKNNQIIPLIRPMFNFALTNTDEAKPAGLTITEKAAWWGGKDPTGAYYADDKTSWVPTDLTLWNQPNNVDLAKTGGAIGFAALTAVGLILVGGGMLVLACRRRDCLRD